MKKIFLTLLFSNIACIAYASKFPDVEVRAIRPRYFSKARKFEIGSQAMFVINRSFIYAYMLSANIGYHIDEAWALEAVFAMGSTQSKEDEINLKESFDITTQILEPRGSQDLAVIWSPMYGKYQLTDGKVVYYDTFMALGGGTVSAEYLYDHCASEEKPAPPAQSFSYSSGNVGVGQRFFLNRSMTFRWDLRDRIFFTNAQDASCDPSLTESQSRLEHNVTIQGGISHFF